MTLNKIIHLSDIHIRKVPTRNSEYEFVFNKLYESLKQQKPDRITIVGDLVDNNLDLQGEQLILASIFLNTLASIAPVRITRGNHDYSVNNSNRVDSVEAIVKTLNNSNIIYYNKTGFFYDENIIWAVWHHGEKNNNPWKLKEAKTLNIDGYTTIDLFHNPINGCTSDTGFGMNNKTYYKISDFSGDLSLFGDIHLQQFLNEEKTKAYPSSLISQNFAEGDDKFHGYILWDIQNKTHELIPIENEYSFKNIKIPPYIDFDDLDIEIDEPTKYMGVRFIWQTLPSIKNVENERKIESYIKSKYDGIIKIAHKAEFIETDKIEINNNTTLENISDKTIQHNIFREYLEKIGVDEKVINDVLAIDEEVLNEIKLEPNSNIQWDIVKFGGKNFMSYGEFDIDWRDYSGLFQIVGENTAGKTTIFKNLTYTLFNKTLETDFQMKAGNLRYVNNRNDADYCESYVIIEANGEYYGIKRKTTLERNKEGLIKDAPTKVSYYLLSTPDDEMNDSTSIDKTINLDDNGRIKTQKKIEEIIGSYDNFNRIVMTTSDTLNKILSGDKSVFIDSILYDSGLDIFDKKLEGLKVYQKKINDKVRISCNIELTTNENNKLNKEINQIKEQINNIEITSLPDLQKRINIGKNFVEEQTKKLYQIDPEIYNLNVNSINDTINIHKRKINEYEQHNKALLSELALLKDTYDKDRLGLLLEKKEAHKTIEYENRLNIRNIESKIREEEHAIEIINGDIFRLNKDIENLNKEINNLKNSRNCPTCNQPFLPEHQEHLDKMIGEKNNKILELKESIEIKETIDKTKYKLQVKLKKKEIIIINTTIQTNSLEMDGYLKEIGNLTNDKNDVEKRVRINLEIEQIPTKIQNEELKIDLLNQKLINHENSLKQIEENQKTDKNILAAKQKLLLIESVESQEKEKTYKFKSLTTDKENRININLKLINDFKLQEYQDSVLALYKKCVHRDGIPKQMLTNYILPKINQTLNNILSVTKFKVWIDEDDLRLKLVYDKRPDSIIDCMSASGKERTFSSIVLKIALNLINVKSKPMFMLLDEITGKLSQTSIEEFAEILDLIKANVKRVLIVEHNANFNPDHIINVWLDENDLSNLSFA